MEHCIIISGVKHILVDKYEYCSRCSLVSICHRCGDFLCSDLFDRPNSHFEIIEDKHHDIKLPEKIDTTQLKNYFQMFGIEFTDEQLEQIVRESIEKFNGNQNVLTKNTLPTHCKNCKEKDCSLCDYLMDSQE